MRRGTAGGTRPRRAGVPAAEGRARRRIGVAALAFLVGTGLAAAAPGPAASQSPDASAAVRPASGPGDGREDDRGILLDIPYIAQSEALCGGAAAAMVLRYWGRRDVYAEDFSSLVTEDEGGVRGIPTADLVGALRERGWHAVPVRGDAAEARRQLARGRPLIALLQVAPRRYHYVVVAGWVGSKAVVHDPADRPWRVLERDELERAWAAASGWGLLVLPSSRADSAATARAGVARATRPDRLAPARADDAAGEPETAEPEDGCSRLVRRGVREARAGDAETARGMLEAAAALCPDRAAPLRELAGLRLRAGDPAAAARLAGRAVDRVPGDGHALRILATARYVTGDPRALDAWGRLAETRIDRVRVDGLERTPYRTAALLIGLEPGDSLRGGDLETARRRLALLPAAADALVEYRPLPDGGVEVEAAVREHPTFPTTPVRLAALGARGAIEGELEVRAAGVAGRGEAWTAGWRWTPRRPRVVLALDAPGALGLPVVWHVEGSWERQTYAREAVAAAVPPEPEPVVEERRRVEAGLGSWASDWLRWRTGASLDRWQGRGSHLGLRVLLEARGPSERTFAGVEGAGWKAFSREGGFATLSAAAGWRSRAEPTGTVWTARVSLTRATRRAPAALWPGAGTGRGRDVLLRAHPLLEDGVVGPGVFGRGLAAGGVEAVRWIPLPPLRVGVAAFVDAARAWDAPSSGAADSRGDGPQVDVGLGLRLGLPGEVGALRLDAARSLRERGGAVSVGWMPAWPAWR